MLRDYFNTEKEHFYLDTTHDVYFMSNEHLNRLSAGSAQLAITSPPYWGIKDYGHEDQIGFNQSLEEYFTGLNRVWKECARILSPGCKLCINIGNQFLKKEGKREYQIIPLYEMLVSKLRELDDFVFLGTIIWKKVSTTNSSGGGKALGSIYYPRNGYFLTNREFIGIFKKKGKDPVVSKEIKGRSRLSKVEWRRFFRDTWRFPGIKQDLHVAMFPQELPERLIKMYSFIGDTVLDPFLGSGSTMKAAIETCRNSIGFELGFDSNSGMNWQDIIKKKLASSIVHGNSKFVINYHEKNL